MADCATFKELGNARYKQGKYRENAPCRSCNHSRLFFIDTLGEQCAAAHIWGGVYNSRMPPQRRPSMHIPRPSRQIPPSQHSLATGVPRTLSPPLGAFKAISPDLLCFPFLEMVLTFRVPRYVGRAAATAASPVLGCSRLRPSLTHTLHRAAALMMLKKFDEALSDCKAATSLDASVPSRPFLLRPRRLHTIRFSHAESAPHLAVC